MGISRRCDRRDSMLIADTSAWIEFLRGSGSSVAVRMRTAIGQREIVTVDPVLLEVMAGARPEAATRTLRLLDAQRFEPVVVRQDWLDAAEIYRGLRQRGETLRSHVDALIAALAMRLELPVLHLDRDYDAIARHVPLRLVDA